MLDLYVIRGLLEYLQMMEPMTLMLHLAYLIFCNRLLFFGNRFRSSFEFFVTLHYVMFLFLPYGWLWVQLARLGPASFGRMLLNGIPFYFPGRNFGLSGLHFILTFLLIVLWFSEVRAPQNDFDFRKVRGWNFWVIPVIVWGFVYPFHPMEERGQFAFIGMSAFWRSPFGVLINPTSTFLLGLLTLIYPRVNFKLFFGMSFALLIIALTALPSSPLEWPMALLAVYNLIAGTVHRIQKRMKGIPSEKREAISPP